MRMASSVSGSSPTERMGLKISRQDIPASTRMRVCVLETTVLLALEPRASPVIRTISLRIRLRRVEDAAETRAGTCLDYSCDQSWEGQALAFLAVEHVADRFSAGCV